MDITNIPRIGQLSPTHPAIKKKYRKRFLKDNTGHKLKYIDLQDPEHRYDMGVVANMIVRWTNCSLNDAFEFVKNTHVNYWSGRTVYRPDSQLVVIEDDKYHLNLWRKPIVLPDPNVSCQPFLDHLRLALKDDAKVNWLLNVLAHRKQNPLSKAHHALYLFGEAQAQGKSLFKETIINVFGSSAVRVCNNPSALMKQNDYQFFERTWLVVEEADVKAGSALYDRLKANTGASAMQADPKHKSSMEVEIPAQLIMLSNRAPNFLEEEDRRFFVAHWDTGLRGADKEAYFDGYIHWLENEQGYAAISNLLHTMEIVNYKLTMHSPTTPEKVKAIHQAVPLEVERLIQYAADRPRQVAFNTSDFTEILRYSDKQKQKSYLQQAGFESDRFRFSETGRLTLYYRQGAETIRLSPTTFLFRWETTEHEVINGETVAL